MSSSDSYDVSESAARMRRILLIGLLAVVALALAGFFGFKAFTAWRARDLAAKAMENFDNANYRMALLQITSARELGQDDTEVLRNAAVIESAFGRPKGLEAWDVLAERQQLSPDELVERARAAARFGNEKEFERAAAELETAGNTTAADGLRTARSLARGNYDGAIDTARQAVAGENDPMMKLDLAKLLLRRYVDRLAQTPDHPISREVMGEMTAIIDSLQGTPAEDEALAFGLTFLRPGKEAQEKWAGRAMQNPAVDNPALLPAAAMLVELGQANAEDLHKRLRPLFDAAPLEQRAAFAAWLMRQKLPREALTLITAQEAGESTQAFLARTEALAAMGNWKAVMEASEMRGNAPQSVRLLVKARAEYGMDKAAQGAVSLRDALRAAVRENKVGPAITEADKLDGGAAADALLIELCGDPGFGPRVFGLARERFSLRGPAGAAALASAFERAQAAAPGATEVQDYARYLKLLAPPEEQGAGGASPYPTPDETAAALAAEPSSSLIRATHALALLRAGQPAEAMAAFDDFTVFFNRMPAGAQAVLCAVYAANNRGAEAKVMAQAIDRSRLSDAEQALLQGAL